jgi:hypothetical protein
LLTAGGHVALSEIRNAAWIIREELAADPDREGPAVQGLLEELDDLLARASVGEDVEDRLWKLLVRQERSRQRLDELLVEVREERGMAPLPGEVGPIEADRYECPHGDYSVLVLDMDDPVPASCPNHHVPLRFVPAG